MRLMAHQNVPASVIKTVQNMKCATCERLKTAQPPRPTALPKMVAAQFGDELQADVFYTRLINGETFMVLGVIDVATGYHQAMIIPDRQAETTYDILEQLWLRPFGIPIKFVCDPDRSFLGEFLHKLGSLGCLVEHSLSIAY